MTLRNQTLGQLALSIPGASAIFRHHQLDYCCGGKQSLSEAAAKYELDLDSIEMALRHLSVKSFAYDWSQMPLVEIIAVIVERYHDGHRAQLPNLIAQSQKVERVHANKPNVPAGLSQKLEALSGELLGHMLKEERVLFPMIKRAMGSSATMPISVMEKEHDEAGKIVQDILHITKQLTIPPEACTTWKVLYKELDEFIMELMDHINLENQVLFPRALAGEIF
jgi:regulator of cell morphogenesis and NO signaling